MTTAAATPGSGTWTCYLVRHGEAGRRAAWEGPDERRPLTAQGTTGAALETPKGATWVFDLARGRVTAGTLLPPP